MIKSLFALLIFSGALQAQEEIGNLSKTTPGDAERFLALRDSFDSQSLPALREASAPDQWTRENWVEALAAEAVRLRLEEPELTKMLDRPRGLAPEVYETFRKPTPLCLRQFRHIGKKGIPLLMERWRWTFDEYPFSEGDKGEKEKMVFRQAILAAAGQTGDQRAQYFLEEILRKTEEDSRWRSEAAISLGMCAGEEALPALLELLDGTSPLDVKMACARALGRIPTEKALLAIEIRLGNPGIDASLITA
ncbi:MAG: HEAT repeat domain-containing protein, partial [Planctomycetota bacterium]|nr:HEAT repeat domain-containing protein [Planctomycetota bacterium]